MAKVLSFAAGAALRKTGTAVVPVPVVSEVRFKVEKYTNWDGHPYDFYHATISDPLLGEEGYSHLSPGQVRMLYYMAKALAEHRAVRFTLSKDLRNAAQKLNLSEQYDEDPLEKILR